MVKIIFILLSFSFSSYAKIVLTFKQDRMGKVLSHSLMYNQNKVVVVRNTNSFCGISEKILLGHFEKKMSTSDETNKKFIDQVLLRLRKGNYQEDKGTAHEKKFFINQFDVTYKENEKYNVLESLSPTCHLKNWNIIEGVEVIAVKKKNKKFMQIIKSENGKQVKTKLIPFTQKQCQQSGITDKKKEVWDCEVPNYGYARLILN